MMSSATENLDVKLKVITDQLDDLKKHVEEDNVKNLANLELLNEYNEKVAEVDALESLNRALIVKERRSNDQLHDARRELINGLRDAPRFQDGTIGVRRMGEINGAPFLDACKQRFPDAEYAAEHAALLCSKWQEELKDADWYPFRIIHSGDDAQAVINEDDEKLRALRNEWGEQVYKAVTEALVEMNEYNPCGGYPVHELWNYEFGRAATLAEVIKHVFTQ